MPDHPLADPSAPPAAPTAPWRAIPHAAGEDLWVFAYGSLMWNPGFVHDRRLDAWLQGWHRGFCVYSWRHRGTPEVPGAVVGLDRGGACRGVAYRIPAAQVEPSLAYLWEREMVNGVYRPRILPIRSQRRAGPATLRALAFTVDRSHRQYCGRLPVQDLVTLVRQGVGQSGRATDYLSGLVGHLRDLGIHDHLLEDLAARVMSVEAGDAEAEAAAR